MNVIAARQAEHQCGYERACRVFGAGRALGGNVTDGATGLL